MHVFQQPGRPDPLSEKLFLTFFRNAGAQSDLGSTRNVNAWRDCGVRSIERMYRVDCSIITKQIHFETSLFLRFLSTSKALPCMLSSILFGIANIY